MKIIYPTKCHNYATLWHNNKTKRDILKDINLR